MDTCSRQTMCNNIPFLLMVVLIKSRVVNKKYPPGTMNIHNFVFDPNIDRHLYSEASLLGGLKYWLNSTLLLVPEPELDQRCHVFLEVWVLWSIYAASTVKLTPAVNVYAIQNGMLGMSALPKHWHDDINHWPLLTSAGNIYCSHPFDSTRSLIYCHKRHLEHAFFSGVV